MPLTKAANRMITGAPANVRDFGAVGDGTTDDTVAIQAALDSGAAKIYIPDGDYKVTGTLTLQPNTHLQGSHGIGRKFNTNTAKCRIRYEGTDTVVIRFNNDSVGYGASRLSDIVIAQLNSTASVTAVEIGNAADTETYTLQTMVDNVTIEDFSGIGILNYGSWNCTLKDIMVHGKSAPDRTTIGFHCDASGLGSTSLHMINCFAEECVTGFKIGDASGSNLYSYSSLINTYVDGCTTGYHFVSAGDNTRYINLYRAGVEGFSGGDVFIVDGCFVSADGLAFVPNGTPTFDHVFNVDNDAVLSIANMDNIPQTGFTGGTALLTADNDSIVRFLNARISDAVGDLLTANGARVDRENYLQRVFKNLDRDAPSRIAVDTSNKNTTIRGYSKYAISAATSQIMAGTPIVDVSDIEDGEIIRFVNYGTTDIILRTEDITAGTGVVKHPDNGSGSGVVISPQDYAEFVKKSDNKLYEIKRFT
tara:strand:- start:1323 stop:2753 length:1431 start_codon:yes stop_codon:yes gene_type:complete